MNSSHSCSISVFFRPTHKPSPPSWDSIHWTFCGSIPLISCVTADSWRACQTLKVNLCYYFWDLAEIFISLLRDASFVWDDRYRKLPNLAFLRLSLILRSSEWLFKFHLQFTITKVAYCTVKYKCVRQEWNCCVLMLISSQPNPKVIVRGEYWL